MSFAHATLKTVPLITCEEVGDPSLSFSLLYLPPSSLSLAGGSGKWGWVDGGHLHLFTVSLSTSLLDSEAGRRESGGRGVRENKKKKKEKKYRTPR